MPAQDKTETPTPRRREELRRKGQVPKSTDFTSGFSFLASFTIITFLVPFIFSQVSEFSQKIWVGEIPVDPHQTEWVWHLGKIGSSYFVKIVAPVALSALGVGLFLGFIQTGFVASLEPLRPKFDPVNPIKGITRLFSLRTFMEALKVSLKVFLGLVLAYVLIKGELPVLANLMGMDLWATAQNAFNLARNLGFSLGGLFLAIGFMDFFYQRYEHERSIKMTKEEVKEEYKKTEGDPLLRSRIRARQREMARQRMMQEIPKAQVVVTNPTHVACALHYQRSQMRAPILVAKGQRLVAEKIKEIARAHSVPIVENKTVAWDLYRHCKVGQEIPSFLYRAVAEILAFVYRLRGGYR
ncbi:MAG: flagellar biosynthesis protein FlhB [Candidatus Atribacteria bacterium]|nr:flagellar biosynthesis protein FlhB [Candidatus Atribacteria bacterium]